uniref:Mannose-P-dolichol utilization defect 1 protein homolog n=1 Tax=Phallusia mammillata TaxID=59560 RepID=A0A6F9DLX9_9ASCI|nr:mannose-P-dolichol utilization defect 1 protein [Phallusia mammillata]
MFYACFYNSFGFTCSSCGFCPRSDLLLAAKYQHFTKLTTQFATTGKLQKKNMNALMSEECYEEFFYKLNFFHGDCLSALISKVLGYSIVAGAVLVKVPQIQKILSAGSAKGLSFTSLLLELYAVTSMFSYSIAKGFPFSTWGDSFFLMLQNIMIGGLIQHYKGSTSGAIGFVVIFLGILGVLMSGITPVSVLAALQASNMPAVVISKMIQALDNYRNGTTGQLSAITVFLIFGGSIARIFTSIQETGDQLVIMNYVVSTICNGIIAAQMVRYWNVKPKAKAE